MNWTMGIAVVAHPQRRAKARLLATTVAARYTAWDTGGIGCAQNHVRALKGLLTAPYDWLVILEDDAQVLERGFRTHLHRALVHAPSPLVSLYLGTGHNPRVQATIRAAAAEADVRLRPWIRADALMAGVAYAVHVSVVCRLLDAIDKPGSELELPLRITRWAQDSHTPVSYTWPSLVDHPDGWSTIAQTELTGRVAHRHGVPVEWSRRWVPMGPIPGWSRQHG